MNFTSRLQVDARDRRLALRIGLGEAVDHRLAEAVLVVEHVVRNRQPFGDTAGVVDVLAGAAGALAVDGLAMIVELQGHPDDVVALLGHQPGDDRRVDAARHGDDHAGFRRRLGDVEAVQHQGKVLVQDGYIG